MRTDIDEKEMCDMYLRVKNKLEVGKAFNCSYSVVNRILKSNGITQKFDAPTKYQFDKNFFDIIDTEDKAYWLGFIWCDGYLMTKDRNNHTEYAFKLDLMRDDYRHLEKLNKSLSSNYPIKLYNNGPSNYSGKPVTICRIHISVKHFGYTLFEKYGMFANRTDVSKLKREVPEPLMKHFIRGVLEADGSFVYYTDEKSNQKKMVMSISSYEDLVVWINRFLYEEKLCESMTKLSQRHEGADGNCRALNFSGRRQVQRILDYLYADANIYLDRKFVKYQELTEFNK